ncbi:MAG: tetraacyldisaccharide 4'-kinase, partial [Bacteroidia bacterium]
MLRKIIEKHWYKKIALWLVIFLLPMGSVYLIIIFIRHLCYKYNIFKTHQLSVPVVIVGNISVGGVGKTPLTLHLIETLAEQGIKAGVILRGYKGKYKKPMVVNNNHNATLVGDEAMIYARHNIPVAIAKNRFKAGLKLLDTYPEIKIIFSDDGLQHYKLERNFEIAVIDSSRLLGNKFVLPMGPLREPAVRLAKVSAVVFNGNVDVTKLKIPLPKSVTILYFELAKIYNPISGHVYSANDLVNKNVVAMAGIGNPERFFNFLEQQKIYPKQTISFPDHHHFTQKDIPKDFDIILVTEKDYTKLKELNNDKIWVVALK